MVFFLQIGLPLVLLFGGYLLGTWAEKKHYRSIIQRETDSTDIIVITAKTPPQTAQQPTLVQGNVVIASDYFKRFVAWLIGIFGGRINVYESLLDRARREAMLRLKDDARRSGANMIVNVKFETATLNDIRQQKNAMVEVLAYGTAVKYTA